MFLSLAVLLSLPMLAEKVEIEGIWYNLDTDSKRAEVTYKGSFYSEYDEYSGVVVIPASVVYSGTTYCVTIIGNYAFSWCESLTSVTIPNSVTSIGEYAFADCDGLTSVTIPNSVESIGDYAFCWCSGLTSVTISNSVTSIGERAFSDCYGLKGINVEDGNKTFDSREGCNAIIETSSNTLLYGCQTTVIPNSVTSIGRHAFSYCDGLTSVTIPNSVESIGNYAFTDCDGLTSVTIPNSVTSIGEWAFRSCSGLTSVTIGNSVESIGESAFCECSGLTSVTIGNSVESIGDYAFEDCSGLTSVTIPNSVTSIGERAFGGCSGLTEMKVDANNSKYDSREGCNAIIETSSNTLISACQTTAIPNSVTSIGTSAFSGCSGLTSVTIPKSVTSIGGYAFSNCDGLQNVYCYAEKVPSTDSYAFSSSNYSNATLHVPTASIESYQTTEPWSSFGTITSLPNQYELSVSSAGYATLCLAYNAEIPQDVEVYVAEKVDGDCLKMKKVEGVLPAMTGVIVKAEAGTYAFTQSENTPVEIGENLLVGSVVNTMVRADENTSYYILAAPDDNNNEVGMYRVELIDDMFECKANKAYLPFDSSAPARIRFDFGTETGISEVKGENENVKTEIYDLSGRKVENAQKGIFIVNGKKVIK